MPLAQLTVSGSTLALLVLRTPLATTKVKLRDSEQADVACVRLRAMTTRSSLFSTLNPKPKTLNPKP